jgi:hypothetical protein
MLNDVFDAVVTTCILRPHVSAQTVELQLPIEVWLSDVAGQSTFIADLPVWRWRTPFDRVPSRMTMTWEAQELRPECPRVGAAVTNHE